MRRSKSQKKVSNQIKRKVHTPSAQTLIVSSTSALKDTVTDPGRSYSQTEKDIISNLNHSLLKWEQEVAFFNFAIKEVTEILSYTDHA